MTIPSSLTAFYKIKGHLLHNKRMYFAIKLSTLSEKQLIFQSKISEKGRKT